MVQRESGGSGVGLQWQALEHPPTAVFVGKSRTITLRIAGETVAKAMPSAKAVTTVPQVAFTGTVEGKSVRLVDAPGLFEQDRSNEETLIQLTGMLREEILGFDTIFHVVRMGRLEEND